MRLVVTPAIRRLLEDARHPCPDDPTISWSDLKAAYARSDYAARQRSLRSVCRGSSIALDALDALDAETRPPSPSVATCGSDESMMMRSATSSTKSEDLQSHLRALQNRLDQKLYDRMVRDVTVEERCAEAARHVSFSSYKEQMRFGAHVISMMVVFFIFGYVAATRVVTSDALRVLCGVVGMFAAMVMETALFIFREARETPDRDPRAARPAAKHAPREPVPGTKDAYHRDETDKRAGKVKIT